MSGRMPQRAETKEMTANGSLGFTPGRGRRTPFGRPVVPEEYRSAAPSASSGTGSDG